MYLSDAGLARKVAAQFDSAGSQAGIPDHIWSLKEVLSCRGMVLSTTHVATAQKGIITKQRESV
jgi:hypothetical protein